MIECNREEQLENVLRQLIERHFSFPELYWEHDCPHEKSLKEADEYLYLQIVSLFPELVESK